MCVRENTARAASVEFVRHRRTNYARSRPQAFCRKNPEGFSTVSDRPRRRSLFAGIPAPASCKRIPHTLQVSLHQSAAGPPPFRQGRLWGRGLRIATASVRTDLTMTGFPWSVVHGRRATARVAPTEGYKECLAGGRTGASAPTDMWKRLRRAGLQEVRKNGPSGTPAPTEGLLMVPYAAGHMGPALHYIIL